MGIAQQSFVSELIRQTFEEPEFVQEEIVKNKRLNALDRIKCLCKLTAEKVDFFCRVLFEIIDKEPKISDESLKTIFNLETKEFDLNGIGSGAKEAPIFEAIKNNNQVFVDFLIKNGADLNIQDEEGFTPLMIACREEKVVFLRSLLSVGADVNHRDSDGSSGLMYAAQNGHRECLKELIDKGADVNNSNYIGMTGLMIAAANGHIECLEELINQGAEVNHKNNKGSNGLMIAAQLGQVGSLNVLIEKGADINHKDSVGKSALILAAQNGYEKCVRALIEKGAVIDQKDRSGCSALIFAAADSHMDCVDALIEKGADINHRDNEGFTALMVAVHQGQRECVRDLIKRGANVNIADNDGMTGLLIAAETGQLVCEQELLAAGAGINDKNHKGRSALMLASQNGFIECVESLIEHNPDYTLVDNDGYTALVYAVINEEIGCLRFLVYSGSDINYQTEEGKTPLMLAIESGKEKSVRELIKLGADVQLSDIQGNQAAYYAAKKSSRMLKILEEKIEHTENKEKTPLLDAIRSRKEEEIALLLEEGASLFEALEEESTVLHFAAKRDAVPLIPSKFLTFAILESQDLWGRTPLIVAVENKRSFDGLLKVGARVKAQDIYGRTALMYAAQNGDKMAIQSLIGMSSVGGEALEINQTDKFGWTALHFAVFYGRINVIKTLLEYGANPNFKNSDGVTPFTLAASAGHHEILQEICTYFDHDKIEIEETDGVAFIMDIDKSSSDIIAILLDIEKGKIWEKMKKRAQVFYAISSDISSFFDGKFNCSIMLTCLAVDPVCCYPLREGENLYFYGRTNLINWHKKWVETEKSQRNKKFLQGGVFSFPLKSEIGEKPNIKRLIELPELKSFIHQMIQNCVSYLGDIESLSEDQIQQKCAEFLKDKDITEAVKNELHALEKIKNTKK